MNQPAREMSDRPNGHIGPKTSATLGDSWPDRRPQLEGIEMFDKQSLEQQMKLSERTIWLAGQLACNAFGGHRPDGGRVRSARAVAGEIKDPPRFKSDKDFSSLKDWHLKAENIVPHGVNPLYYPIVPGHKHVHERPDHPDGKYRKETVVLDSTEDFDLPGIGKFKTAVVQEEEYLDGTLTQRALNWFAVDKTTNSVYVFGEVSWEINEEGKPIFAGTWRVGELDGDGVAEPGLLMPGTFTVGGRYMFDGSKSAAYGGAENMEAGIEITVPAGTFKNCVRVREQGLQDLKRHHRQDLVSGGWRRAGHFRRQARRFRRAAHGQSGRGRFKCREAPRQAAEVYAAGGEGLGRPGDEDRARGDPRQGHLREDRAEERQECLRGRDPDAKGWRERCLCRHRVRKDRRNGLMCNGASALIHDFHRMGFSSYG